MRRRGAGAAKSELAVMNNDTMANANEVSFPIKKSPVFANKKQILRAGNKTRRQWRLSLLSLIQCAKDAIPFEDGCLRTSLEESLMSFCKEIVICSAEPSDE